MKNLFKIVAFVGVLPLVLSGCLKDTPTTDYSDTSIKPIVLIPNGNFPATAEAPLVTFEVSSTPEEIKLYARVSWSKPLGKAVDVVFEKSTAIINEFNQKFGTSYQEMNADGYSIPTLTVTIPANENEAYIPIKIFTDKVSLTQANMLAFKITSAGGQEISSNFQKIVFPIGVKNRWDGIYSARLWASGWGGFGIQDNQGFSVPGLGLGMVTAGANSVSYISYANGNTNLLPGFTNTGGFTAFGATTPRITFDAATNAIVSITNTTPDDGRGRALALDPAVTNSRYDPATKKIFVAYIMKQNGRPDMIRRDTLTYVGKR